MLKKKVGVNYPEQYKNCQSSDLNLNIPFRFRCILLKYSSFWSQLHPKKVTTSFLLLISLTFCCALLSMSQTRYYFLVFPLVVPPSSQGTLETTLPFILCAFYPSGKILFCLLGEMHKCGNPTRVE